MIIVPSGAVAGGKRVYCAEWRSRLREICSLCQVAEQVAGNMFIVPSGAVCCGKRVHCAKWRSRLW